MKRFYLSLMLLLAVAFSTNEVAAQCVPRVNFFCCEILPNNGCGTYTAFTPYSPGEYFRTPTLVGASYTVSTCGNSIDTEITGFEANQTATAAFYNDDNGPECGGTQASHTWTSTINDYYRIAVQQFSCQPGGTQSITVNLRQNNNLSITSAGTDMCQGDTRNLTATPAAVAGGQPNSGDLGTFSGTGVSGTVFTAPTPAGASATYTITYTFGYCSTTQDITVFQTPGAPNAGVDQTVCGGTATLAATGVAFGTGTWSVVSGPGSVTSVNDPASGVTGLLAGSPTTFRWTWTNGPCTPTTDDVIITSDDNPTPANAGTDQSICATSSTMAGNTPSVGTGTWSVVSGSGTWTNSNDPNSAVTGLGSGANVFEWTITNGVCPPSTDQITITVDDPPTPANAGPDQTICSSSATLAGNTPSIGSGMWTLVGGSGTITSNTDPASGVTGLGIGSNTFRWTTSNGACTDSQDDVVITVDQAPTTSNAGSDQTICGSSATLGGNAPAIGTGMWSVVTGSGTFANATDPLSGVTGLGSGTNTFEWTITNGSCPPSTDQITITVDDPPSTANAGADQTPCADSTFLAGNTPTTGTGMWTVISGSGSFANMTDPASLVNGLGAGLNQFVWTISNGSCPSSADTVDITYNGMVTHTAALTHPLCNGDSNGQIDITPAGGAGPYQHSIDNGVTWQAGSSFTGLGDGSYDVLVQDANGCMSVVSSETLVEPAVLTFTTTITHVDCNGASTGSIDIIASGGTPPGNYSIDGGVTFQAGSLFSGLPAGTYNLVIEDANLCQSTGTATITEATAITTSTSSTDASCGQADGTASVTASGGTGTTYTYLWDDPGAQTTATATGLNAGSYIVTVTDSLGCMVTDTVVVNNAGGPTVTTSGTDASCNGTCDGTATASATGGTPPLTYLWDDPGAQTTMTATGLCAGTYSVTVTDANSCASIETITITEPTAMALSATSTDEMLGNDGTIDLTVTGGTPPYTFNWDIPSTVEDPTGLVAGTYMVTVTDANGCTDTLSVTVGSQVGIDEYGYATMKVFPNPNSGEFTIVFEDLKGETLTIRLMDVQGKMIVQDQLNNITGDYNLPMSIHNVESGMYILQVIANDKTVTRRIIKN